MTMQTDEVHEPLPPKLHPWSMVFLCVLGSPELPILLGALWPGVRAPSWWGTLSFDTLGGVVFVVQMWMLSSPDASPIVTWWSVPLLVAVYAVCSPIASVSYQLRELPPPVVSSRGRWRPSKPPVCGSSAGCPAMS